MTSRLASRVLIFSVCLFGMTGPLPGDPPVDGKSSALELLAFAKREAAAHTFRIAGSGTPLLLQPESVLNWSNPIVGDNYGAVFLWTSKGRPEVVWSLHRWHSAQDHRPHEAVEYLSLSAERIIGEKDGQALWTPSRPGLNLKPITGAPVPAETRAGRLRQMRELAKEFTSRQTNRKGVEHDMRLLTQPVYRYEGTEAPVFDGALFAFTQGTDPEIFLLIEARQVGGKREWQYSLSRMTSIELRVHHRGTLVWRAPLQSWDEVQDTREPYMSFVMR
jgi:hypothetical protein